jgi:antitoxin ParD1/3/4
MEISLSPEQVSFLERQVQSGRFASAEDAIRGAVDLLELHEADDLVGWDIDELRREVQLGIDQLDRGEGIEMDEAALHEMMEGVKARGRARLARESAAPVSAR